MFDTFLMPVWSCLRSAEVVYSVSIYCIPVFVFKNVPAGKALIIRLL